MSERHDRGPRTTPRDPDGADREASDGAGEAEPRHAPPGREAATGNAGWKMPWLIPLLALAAFIALYLVTTTTRDTRFVVAAVTQWMAVTLGSDPASNRWPIDGMALCSPLDDGTCAPVDEVEAAFRPVLVLQPGTDLVFVSRGGDRMVISVMATPERPALLVDALDGRPLLEGVEDTLLLTVQRGEAHPHNVSVAFYGKAEVGRVAGQAAGIMLHGEASVVGRPLLGPRYLAYSQALDTGDTIVMRAADDEPADVFGVAHLNADLDRDGFSVQLQGKASYGLISRFSGLDRRLEIRRPDFMLANPITLYISAIGVLLVLLAAVFQGICWMFSQGGSGTIPGQPVVRRLKLLLRRRWMPAVAMVAGLFALQSPMTEAGPRQALLTDFEQGQAALVHDGGACLAIAPLHVLKGNTRGYFTPEAGMGARYPGFLLHELPFDIAILEVPEIPVAECGVRLSDLAKGVRRPLSLRGGLQLRMVTDAGDVRSRRAHAEMLSGATLLVSPDGHFDITTGMSGALISADGDPVAMLLRAREGGIGEALRLDFVAYWIMPLVQAGAAVRESERLVAGGAVSLPARLLRVTARPASDSRDAEVLLADPDGGDAWRAVDPPYPVEVELGLGAEDGMPEIGCVRVDLRQVASPRTKPRTYELLISSTADGRDHRTLAHGTIPRETAVWATRLNVPVRAQRLLLRVRSNWGDPRELSIGRLTAYASTDSRRCESTLVE